MSKNMTGKQLALVLGFVVLVAAVLRITQIGDTNADIPASDYLPDSLAQGSAEEDDVIILNSPSPSQIQAREVQVSGQARPDWFKDGIFPASIVDAKGQEIAHGDIAMMAEKQGSLVAFAGQISIPESVPVPAEVVLHLEPGSGDGRYFSLNVPLEVR